jgi:hypothetical protein
MTHNRYLAQIYKVAFYSDLNATRFTLGLAEILWAVTLLWPGETFGRPTYAVMSHVMNEEAWGLLFLFSGMMQFTLLFQGIYHDKFAVRFAAWNTVLWCYVVASMYLSVSPPPAAISGELALAVAAFWVFIRSGYVITGRRGTDRD